MTDHTMKKNPVSIPHTVWYADDIRRGEREAADALGLTLYELMLRAGEAAFQVCRSAYPDARHWLVLCGHGNNGGDGYVVARLAKAVGIEVTLLAQESDKPLPEEAALAREAWLNIIINCYLIRSMGPMKKRFSGWRTKIGNIKLVLSLQRNN